MHFGGNEVAFFYRGYFIADGDDLAAKLMSWNQRRMNAALRPAVPLVDVEIGSANGSDLDLDQNIGGAEGGNFHFTNFGAGGSRGFHHRLHGFRHYVL